MRILLAEDDKDLNKALTWQLAARGYNVDSCGSGEEALYYGKQNIYDVILLDRMLPDKEGTEVMTTLRKLSVNTPIILITALGLLQDKITGLDLGADDYLVKPFDFEELLARIRCVTRRSASLSTQPDGLISYHDITWSPRGLYAVKTRGRSAGKFSPFAGRYVCKGNASVKSVGARQRSGKRQPG